MGKENQQVWISRRIIHGCTRYKLSYNLKSKPFPIVLKSKPFDSCILLALAYDIDIMTLTNKAVNKLKTTQRSIEKSILGVTLRDSKRSYTEKWNLAGHNYY